MDTNDFLRWDAQQSERSEWIGGEIRDDPNPAGGGGYFVHCLNVCISVQDRMEQPARWRNGRVLASRGQIRCANGNVRLVDAMISCEGGRHGPAEDYGLVVMCLTHRPSQDFEACLEDILATPKVHNIVVADFEAQNWTIFRKLDDRSWQRSRMTGHDWSLDLSGTRGTLEGTDFDLSADYEMEGAPAYGP